MSLRRKFTDLVYGNRLIPKFVYEELTGLDTRLATAEGKITTIEGKEVEDKIVTVAVNISATNSNGSSAADEDLIGATVLGIVPVGNQDQFVDSVVVGEDGKVTVTLAGAATAQNQFNVTVLKV